MNRRSLTDLVTGARVIADNAEQIAQAFGRTVAAVQGIVDDCKVINEVASPFVERFKATPAGPPVNMQVAGSMKRAR